MSREIDLSKPPTQEDLEYLDSRGRGDLIARLVALHGEPAEADEEDVPSYDKWKKADLIEEANVRGLDASGTVAELASRLEEDDESGE